MGEVCRDRYLCYGRIGRKEGGGGVIVVYEI